jgi:hypothetical protein
MSRQCGFAATHAANAATYGRTTSPIRQHYRNTFDKSVINSILLTGSGNTTVALARYRPCIHHVCTPYALKRRLLLHQLEPPCFK